MPSAVSGSRIPDDRQPLPGEGAVRYTHVHTGGFVMKRKLTNAVLLFVIASGAGRLTAQRASAAECGPFEEECWYDGILCCVQWGMCCAWTPVNGCQEYVC